MQSPEELAHAFIERTRLPPGVRDMFEDELVEMLRAYGAACAAAERESCITAVLEQANNLPADVDDGFYAGYKLAIRNAIEAIRALD